MEKIQSLREMSKAARNDIRIMWLTDELKPSHQAINNFIHRHLKVNIEEIFYDLNKLLIEKENINTSRLYIDGTKIESNANKYTFVWRGSIEKFSEKLYKKITVLFEKMNMEYEYENIYFPVYDIYDESHITPAIIFIEKEIEKHEIEFVYGKGKHKTSLQKFYELLVEYKEKLKEYKEHLKIMGPDRNSYSKTDKDATFMRMKDDHMHNSQLKPGYNIQIGVSDEYILHVGISSERNDYRTLIPFLEGFKTKYGYYPKYPVGDSGYGGLINYRYMKLNDMEIYTKYNMYEKDTKDKKRMKDPYLALNLKKDNDGNFIDPGGGTYKFLYRNKRGNDVYYVPSLGKNRELNEELMSYQKEAIKNLQSDLGIELRVQRSIQVEGAFGVIKDVFKVRRFRRILTENVKLEFLLVAIGYNLSKYHNKRYRIVN
ncbi:MAG: transposase [Acholeplasmataceae bacterium]|nr:transposase [Acholeplasmataceae bacterium]